MHTVVWGCGIWIDDLWRWSFIGCRWPWPYCWLHLCIWSGFSRRVGMEVFVRCSFVSIHPRISPFLHRQNILCAGGLIFFLFGCGFTLFDFLVTIWICLRGGCWVVKVLMYGLNPVKHLGALSGSLFFTLVAGSLSHCFVSFFSEKKLDRLLQGRTFPINNFFDWRHLCRFFQKRSYIGYCLCGGV